MKNWYLKKLAVLEKKAGDMAAEAATLYQFSTDVCNEKKHAWWLSLDTTPKKLNVILWGPANNASGDEAWKTESLGELIDFEIDDGAEVIKERIPVIIKHLKAEISRLERKLKTLE